MSQDTPRDETSTPARRYILHATVAAVAIVACEFVLVRFVTPRLFAEADTAPMQAWGHVGLVRGVQALVLLGLLLAAFRWSARDLGIGGARLRTTTLGVALPALLLLPMLGVAVAVSDLWHWVWPQASPVAVAGLLGVPAAPSVVQVVGMAFVVGLVVPFAEELAFRGALRRALVRWLSPAGRVLIVAALFALAHGLAGFLLYAAAGVLLGVLREWLDNLWAPIALHAGANLALLALGVALAVTTGGAP